MQNSWIPSAPVTVNWALTNRCNFSCRHCYSRNDPADELGFDTLVGLVEKISRAKVFSVNFGGGEPLLRKDIFEIARYASNVGLVVSMNSNGFLIGKDTALRLKESGFRRVGISIDSPKHEVHDAFRGMKRSHAKAVLALGYLRDVGIETSISSVICKINRDDIDGLIGQAIALGTGTLNFHNFKCSGLGYTNKDMLDLSPAEWRDFYRHVSEQKKNIRGLHISLEDPIAASIGERVSAALVKGSVCGKLSLNIKTNGDITPCGFIPIVIGNLCTDDISILWKNSPVLEKLRHKTPKGKCIRCSHYSECLGGCTARSLALTGDINSPDPHCWESESSGS